MHVKAQIRWAAPLALMVLAVAGVGQTIAAGQIIQETTPGTPTPKPRPRRRHPRPSLPPTAATPAPVIAPPGPPRRRVKAAPPTTTPTASADAAPTLLWRTLLRRGNGVAVGSGGAAFVAATSQICGVDAGGHTLWATDTGPTTATPLSDEARVYVGTDRGAVYAADPVTGKPLWKWTGTTGATNAAPAVGGGRLYIESTDNYVYGLAASTGGQIWKFLRPDGSLGYSAPVYAGERALYSAGDNTLYRIDAAVGREIWHTALGGRSLSPPVVGGGRVYVGGDGAGLVAASEKDGVVAWTFRGRLSGDWFGSPALGGDTVYAATARGLVYGVNAATGKARWSYTSSVWAGGFDAPPPLTLDSKRGLVYVATSSRDGTGGVLTALDARLGIKRWEIKTGIAEGAPVVSDGRLYLACTNGYLYAFGLR